MEPKKISEDTIAKKLIDNLIKIMPASEISQALHKYHQYGIQSSSIINLLLKYNKIQLKSETIEDLVYKVKEYSEKLNLSEPILLVSPDAFIKIASNPDISTLIEDELILGSFKIGDLLIMADDMHLLNKTQDKTIHNCILFTKDSILTEYKNSEITSDKTFINPEKVVLIQLKLGE